jgi:hypothetical protein
MRLTRRLLSLLLLLLLPGERARQGHDAQHLERCASAQVPWLGFGGLVVVAIGLASHNAPLFRWSVM